MKLWQSILVLIAVWFWGYFMGAENGVSLKNEVANAVSQCESELKRNESCDYSIIATKK